MPLRQWAAALFFTALTSASLAEWTEFRGPNHDGISEEKIAWPKAGPKQLWRVPVGADREHALGRAHVVPAERLPLDGALVHAEALGDAMPVHARDRVAPAHPDDATPRAGGVRPAVPAGAGQPPSVTAA